MKNKSFSFLFLVVLIVSLCMPAAAATKAEVDTIVSRFPEDWPTAPDISSASVILVDADSQAILYAKNPTASMYPASTTKLMTALLALENLSFDDVITFSRTAVNSLPSGSSHIGMKAGESKEGVEVKFPKDAAPEPLKGKKALYSVTVKTFRRRVMPDDATFVADAKAEKGKSIELSFKHYEWSANFPMRSVAYDPGVDYLVRVRLRADVRKAAPPAAEVFWAGAYDPVQKRGLGKGLSLKAKDVKDGWAWYDVCTFRPTDDSYVWIGPGRFDKGKCTESPAHRGVWVDAVEIVRK